MPEEQGQAEPASSRPIVGVRTRGGSRFHAISLGIVLLLAAAVRFPGLGQRDIWFDESCTFYASKYLFDLPERGPDLHSELGHIPYFLAVNLWIRVVGESPGGLRSLSAVFGCLGVAIIGVLGTCLCGHRTGIIAALLAALHPLHIHYSQEARAYTLWTACISAALFLICQCAQDNRLRSWLAYVVAAGFCTVTHYYTLLWLPATFLAVICATDRGRFIKHWFIFNGILGALLLPFIVAFVLPFSEHGPNRWLSEVWLTYGSFGAVFNSLWVLLPAGAYPSYLGRLALAPATLERSLGEMLGHVVVFGPAALVVVVGLTAVLGRFGRRAGVSAGESEAIEADGASVDGHERRACRPCRALHRQAAFFLGVSVAFLLIAYVFSWWFGPRYVVGRYDMAAWPSMVLGIACLIAADAGRLQPHGRGGTAGGAVAVALLLACSVATVAAARSVLVRRVAAERAERIKAAVGPEDLVVSVAMYRWFMEYEWQRQGFEAEVFSFPPEHDRQLCWDDPERELADAAGLARGVSQVVSRVREALAESRSVWLLAHGEPSGPRWEVDGKLFAGLAAAGIEVRPYDEAVGLARLGHATKGERKGAREQGSKGAREQGSEGARERGSEGARDQGSREMEGRSGNLKLGAGDGARVVDDDLRSQISMRVSGTCARVQ